MQLTRREGVYCVWEVHRWTHGDSGWVVCFEGLKVDAEALFKRAENELTGKATKIRLVKVVYDVEVLKEAKAGGMGGGGNVRTWRRLKGQPMDRDDKGRPGVRV